MELKDFIKNTLVSIAKGLKEATDEVKESNTKEIGIGMFAIETYSNETDPKHICFDVAVTVSEEKRGKGEAAINVWAAKAGAGGTVKNASENVSRVSFKVFCGDKKYLKNYENP